MKPQTSVIFTYYMIVIEVVEDQEKTEYLSKNIESQFQKNGYNFSWKTSNFLDTNIQGPRR